MKPTHYFAAALLVLAAGGTPNPASAAIVAGIVENGNFVTDFSETNELDIDVLLNNFDGVSFTTTLEAGDGPLLAFSALLDNFTGQSLGQLTIALSGGATFSQFNFVDAGAGAVGSITGLGTSTLQLSLSPRVPTGDSLQLGFPSDDLFDPPAVDPGIDFFIGLNGLQPGQSFGVEIGVSPVAIDIPVVPEPASLAIWGLGAGAMLLFSRKRRARQALANNNG